MSENTVLHGKVIFLYSKLKSYPDKQIEPLLQMKDFLCMTSISHGRSNRTAVLTFNNCNNEKLVFRYKPYVHQRQLPFKLLSPTFLALNFTQTQLQLPFRTKHPFPFEFQHIEQTEGHRAGLLVINKSKLEMPSPVVCPVVSIK